MDIVEYRDYCLSLPLTEETTPFNEDVLVFKIDGKMFAYGSMSEFTWIGLKCDPQEAVELRERFDEIGEGPHMSPKHWIWVRMDGDLDDEFIKQLIKKSYMLVIAAMGKGKREALIKNINELFPNNDLVICN